MSKMSNNEKVHEAARSYGEKEPNAITWARLRAGITTQKHLARLTGIHPTIINELERGKREMNPHWAIRIAKVTGVDWKDLMI